MDILFKKEPKIRISYDEMEAYLLLPYSEIDEDYEFYAVMEKVRAAGIKIGVDENKISAMINERYY